MAGRCVKATPMPKRRNIEACRSGAGDGGLITPEAVRADEPVIDLDDFEGLSVYEAAR